jgi:methionyl-tRNA synthetase
MVFAALAQPFIPEASAKIRKAFGEREDSPSWPTHVTDTLDRGGPITVPDVLFAKIEDEQLATWIERFGGPDKRTT